MTGREAPRRVGVLGGAFDPPHLAHSALAEAACAQLGLDVLHVVPTGVAWHKARPLTAAEHRLAMARLAFAPIPQALIDDREVLRQGPSYTVDTLRELKLAYPSAQLFLVMGADQTRSFLSWHAWQEIARLAIICVAARADSARPDATFDMQLPAQADVRLLQMPLSALSSSRVRDQVATQEGDSPLVFDSVARYIASHHLYQND